MTEIASLTLPQAREAHDEKSKVLAKAFQDAKTDDPDVLDMEKVTGYTGTNEEKRAAMVAAMSEINELGAHIEKLRDLIDAGKGAENARRLHDPVPITHPDGKDNGRTEVKSLGKLFLESEAYTKRGSRGVGPETDIDLEKAFGEGVHLKTLFNSAVYAVQPQFLTSIVTPSNRPLRVSDLMPNIRVTSSAITYMEETTTTPAAAETSESASKPEAALAFTLRTELISKIAVSLPITTEMLEDLPFIEDYINTRLRYFVEAREDQQLLLGNGTAPNISGIQDRSIQTQAKGADPTPDAIYKAMTKVRLYEFEPDGLVIHPNDWQQIALLRTSDDNYFWGGPVNSAPERIWGMPVVITTAETEGTGLVGAFAAGGVVLRRSDITFQVGLVNDQLLLNQRTIIAEERLGLMIPRPNLFCTVTGI